MTTVAPKTVPIPRNSDELAEMLGDPGRMKPVLASSESLGEFISAYARTQQGEDTALRQTVAAETQRALAQWLKDNEDGGVKRLNLSNAVDPQNVTKRMIKSRAELAAGFNPRAAGAVLDKEFDSSGDFAYTVFSRNPAAQEKLHRLVNAYSSTTPSDGGFLIPETLRSQLMSVALETSVVRPRAYVVPMESLRVPFPVVDSTTNNGSVYGGMIGYWTEEAGALTATQAKFGRVVLEAKKLTGYSELPNELLTDSNPALSPIVDRMWPEALAFFEDVAFMTGSGVGEPLGFIGSQNAAAIAVTKETAQAADTIVWENLVNMFARMLPASLNRAVWLASLDTFPQLATMALSVGTGGSPVWINNGAAGAPMTILGRPVIFTEKCQTLGNRGDIAFADLGYYLIGDRQQMTAAQSEHYLFKNDQTAVRLIQRVDGRPWLLSAITPQNGGNTLSPFVELAERA